MTEKDLIAQFVKGKQSAFEALYNEHSAKIFGICLRYAKNPEDAEDLLHYIFVKIFENRKRFDIKYRHFFPWAKQLAINHIINALQKRVHFTDNTIENTFEDEAETTDKGEMLEYLSNPKNVLHMLQTTPEGYRVIFNMHVMDGLDHRTISQTLGISVGTSKSQLARAKQYLQKELNSLHPNTALKAS